MSQRPRHSLPLIPIVAAACLLTPAWAEDGERTVDGWIEILFRNVSVDGADARYDEDFDGLGSGTRLGGASIDYRNPEGGALDFVRFDAQGLGGDPYESTRLRLGRKDVYELSFSDRKQTYLYDLFELADDEDGHSFDTERRRSDLKLTFYPNDTVKFFLQYEEGERTGNSLFMKDIQRELYRMESPLDQRVRRTTVGADIRQGDVDILVRQTLRRYSNRFVNETEGDFGLGGNSELDIYDWRQNESGEADLTTVKLRTPLGSRVSLSVGVHGTLLGEEELKSGVDSIAQGLDFTSTPFVFGMSCSVSGNVCRSDADCDPVGFPGDTCSVGSPAFSTASIEQDTMLSDLELSVALARRADLHLAYRKLERDVDSIAEVDLEGTGTPEEIDSSWEYDIETITALIDIRPVDPLTLRLGYRTIDRSLDRELLIDTVNVGGVRNTDFESGDDGTAVFGLVWRPNRVFRLSADYEDGDIERAFTATSPYETERLRVRLAVNPAKGGRFQATWLDFENRNTGVNFRDPLTNFAHSAKGSNGSLAWSNEIGGTVDYSIRYAWQEIATDTRIVLDTAGFGGTDPGDSLFDTDYSQWTADLRFRRGMTGWNGHVRVWWTDADGTSLFAGDTLGDVNRERVDRTFTDFEVGVQYAFDSGIYAGARVRSFDYDDVRNRFDYDGSILSLVAGMRF